MAEIGNGYGSECHLLRWMGRHRKVFDERILEKIGTNYSSIQWHDFKFDSKKAWPDAELKGLEFLEPDDSVQSKWREFWPNQGKVPNWDAVGSLIIPQGSKEYLLVEAKAHIEELKSDCKAESSKSVEKIDAAFEEVKINLGIVSDNDWKKQYYQFANRVAFLYFLHEQKIEARFLFIYFIGDEFLGNICPKSKDEWEEALKEQYAYLGLDSDNRLKKKIHTLFLRVDSEER